MEPRHIEVGEIFDLLLEYRAHMVLAAFRRDDKTDEHMIKAEAAGEILTIMVEGGVATNGKRVESLISEEYQEEIKQRLSGYLKGLAKSLYFRKER